MTEWDIGVLVLINLLIACGLFFHWRSRKNDIQNRHPSKKVSGQWLLFWLVGIGLVGIGSLCFIDYTRSVSGPLVGMRLIAVWAVCFAAINVWHRRELRKAIGEKKISFLKLLWMPWSQRELEHMWELRSAEEDTAKASSQQAYRYPFW